MTHMRTPKAFPNQPLVRGLSPTYRVPRKNPMDAIPKNVPSSSTRQSSDVAKRIRTNQAEDRKSSDVAKRLRNKALDTRQSSDVARSIRTKAQEDRRSSDVQSRQFWIGFAVVVLFVVGNLVWAGLSQLGRITYADPTTRYAWMCGKALEVAAPHTRKTGYTLQADHGGDPKRWLLQVGLTDVYRCQGIHDQEVVIEDSYVVRFEPRSDGWQVRAYVGSQQFSQAFVKRG